MRHTKGRVRGRQAEKLLGAREEIEHVCTAVCHSRVEVFGFQVYLYRRGTGYVHVRAQTCFRCPSAEFPRSRVAQTCSNAVRSEARTRAMGGKANLLESRGDTDLLERRAIPCVGDPNEEIILCQAGTEPAKKRNFGWVA